MTDRDAAAMRNAMMIDAAWQRADAKFNAACEVRVEMPEARRLQRAKWTQEYHSRPEQRKRRNAQNRARRRAARDAYRSLLTPPENRA